MDNEIEKNSTVVESEISQNVSTESHVDNTTETEVVTGADVNSEDKDDEAAAYKCMLFFLGLALVCGMLADFGLFSLFHFRPRGLAANILKFLVEEVPTWIWYIVSASIEIGFLCILRSALPIKLKTIDRWINVCVVLVAIDCVLSLFGESEILETLEAIIALITLVAYGVLGFSLRKNFSGKIKGLGNTFIVMIVLSILWLIIASVITDDIDLDSFFIWALIITAVSTALELMPWWYMTHLIKKGELIPGVKRNVSSAG
ncbi:MAG: hypothetical protein K2G09_00605 [Paramuribaculum sp.]|nr:hypothetical protein [Paramuribaculum sp.]